MFPERILLLVKPKSCEFESAIKDINLNRFILRKLSYCYELDFRTTDIQTDLTKIQKICDIISVERAEELPSDLSQKEPINHNLIIREAQSLIARERYWKAHVLLEIIWNKETGYYRKGIQGLIWLLVALVHYQMQESSVSDEVFKRARTRMQESGFGDIYSQLPETFEYPISLNLESLLR